MRDVQQMLVKSSLQYPGLKDLRRVVDKQIEAVEKKRTTEQQQDEDAYQVMVCGEAEAAPHLPEVREEQNTEVLVSKQADKAGGKGTSPKVLKVIKIIKK